jgi:hypothetical protein
METITPNSLSLIEVLLFPRNPGLLSLAKSVNSVVSVKLTLINDTTSLSQSSSDPFILTIYTFSNRSLIPLILRVCGRSWRLLTEAVMLYLSPIYELSLQRSILTLPINLFVSLNASLIRIGTRFRLLLHLTWFLMRRRNSSFYSPCPLV